jgi:acyl-CoA synthetase (AMP-forming)/AMP-acid ligase II
MNGVPEPQTIEDLVFRNNQDPDHHVLESPGNRPLTYRQLHEQVIYVVKNLNAQGFERNDRIAIITPAGPETAVLIIAVMAGFTCVSLNPQYKHDEYERYFSRLRINAVIVMEGYDTAARSVAETHNLPVIGIKPAGEVCGKFTLIPECATEQEPCFATAEDIAFVVLTSGTTENPKIVPLTQRLICISAARGSAANQYTITERALLITPYYHMIANSTLMQVIHAGGTVICTRDFIAPDFVPLLQEFRPTCYSAPPALHQAILRHLRKTIPGGLKNNSLRFIRSISAFMPVDLRSRLEEMLDVPVMETYGMSEVGMAIAATYSPKKPGFVGKPIVEHLAIIDDEDSLLGPGEPGEIVVRGATVFDGYEGAPAENAAAFINGWFRTGDIGYLDDEGYLWLSGRKKELINKGGEKITPAEIDAVLISHPGVRDAMAFPVKDKALGEEVAAMVVRETDQLSEEELRRYLLDRLVQFKVPQRIYFVQEIPRSVTGKLLRYTGTKRYSQNR